MAVAELLSRYRDAPWRAATSKAGFAYVAFNLIISVAALYLMRWVYPIHDFQAGAPTRDLGEMVTEVLLAGTAAMAVLRSSLFTTRVGDKDVQIGLASLMEIFRVTIDRDVDRVRAGPRAKDVARIMAEISFVRAAVPLTSMCMNLLQNISAEERVQIEQKVAALDNQTGRSDTDKALELGLILAGSVGFPVLEAATERLREKIAVGTPREVLVADAVARLPAESIARDLPLTCLALAVNLPAEQQAALGEQIDLVNQTESSDAVKAINIGVLLVNNVGEDTFLSAVNLLASVRGDDPPVDAVGPDEPA